MTSTNQNQKENKNSRNQTEEEQGCSFDQSPEVLASLELGVVEWALKQGADPNEVCTCYEGAPTPLWLFAKYNSNPEILRVLIQNGALVNFSDEHGDTPLMASAFNTPEVVEVLLENGADVHACNQVGWQALHHFAADSEFTESIELLIKHGADKDYINLRGQTPLSTCLFTGVCPEVLTTLVRNNAGLPLGVFFEIEKWILFAEQKGRTPAVVERLKSHYENGETCCNNLTA